VERVIDEAMRAKYADYQPTLVVFGRTPEGRVCALDELPRQFETSACEHLDPIIRERHACGDRDPYTVIIRVDGREATLDVVDPLGPDALAPEEWATLEERFPGWARQHSGTRRRS
jgi:hypothetical protein